ncbi:MAG: hypothetical protein ACOXZH_02050 [Bacteroidales bacterium]|jgi:hypothetical protein
MAEYINVEKPFLDKLRQLGWQVIDQGIGVPQEPEKSLRENFKQVLLPQVFKDSIKAINKTTDGREWLSDKQLEDIIFVIKNKKSGFFETERTKLNTYSLDSINFTDVELFECKDCKENLKVKKMYRVRNLGIISFELVNGEVWINENLSKTGLTTMDSFEYSENTCE